MARASRPAGLPFGIALRGVAWRRVRPYRRWRGAGAVHVAVERGEAKPRRRRRRRPARSSDRPTDTRAALGRLATAPWAMPWAAHTAWQQPAAQPAATPRHAESSEERQSVQTPPGTGGTGGPGGADAVVAAVPPGARRIREGGQVRRVCCVLVHSCSGKCTSLARRPGHGGSAGAARPAPATARGHAGMRRAARPRRGLSQRRARQPGRAWRACWPHAALRRRQGQRVQRVQRGQVSDY